jgi:nucleotide-binding universal stress UspA family protein
VAAEVLRHAPCPLLILRKPASITHILLALDGSALAEQGIQPALALAQALGSKVTLLRVCESENAGGNEADAYLSRAVPQNPWPGIEVSRAIATGPAAPAILNYAKEHDVDVIAMTTHGRSGLRRLIYGSITESVAADPGCCAMLIVKPA